VWKCQYERQRETTDVERGRRLGLHALREKWSEGEEANGNGRKTCQRVSNGDHGTAMSQSPLKTMDQLGKEGAPLPRKKR